jgi:hypothetical protein
MRRLFREAKNQFIQDVKDIQDVHTVRVFSLKCNIAMFLEVSKNIKT